MTTQALYRVWRPKTWDEFVGQEHIVRVLRNAIKSNRLTHAYLFSGPRGTGKTTMARMLARAINCLDNDLENRPCDHCANCEAILNNKFLDIIEIDAASNTSVEDVRDLRDKINFLPAQGRMKVYIIDEVHMLSTAAFNALLKTLEEPPAHAMFILATTEIQKIPATVLSRCQHHEFRRFPVNEIVSWLTKICEAEHFEFEPDALTLIARQSTGAMRDAVSMLDQLSSVGDAITLASAQTVLGVAANQAVIQLVDEIIARNSGKGLEILHQSIDTGTDPRQLARQMVEYLRLMMIVLMGSQEHLETTDEIRAKIIQQAGQIKIDRILEIIQAFNFAAYDNRAGWHPGLSLEIALAKSCEESQQPQPIIHTVAPSRNAAPPSYEKPIGQQAKKPTPSDSMPDVDEVESDESMFANAKIFIKKGLQPDPTVTKEEILKNWNQVRELIKKYDPIIDATLNHARVLEVRNGVLYLGFTRETIKTHIESNHKVPTWTSAAISKTLDKPVGVALTIISGKAKSSVQNNPLLDAAIELGGKLVVNQEKKK